MVCARTALTCGRRQHGGYDWIRNLVFDDVRRLPHPLGVNDDLDVGNVREAHRAESGSTTRCRRRSARQRQ